MIIKSLKPSVFILLNIVVFYLLVAFLGSVLIYVVNPILEEVTSEILLFLFTAMFMFAMIFLFFITFMYVIFLLGLIFSKVNLLFIDYSTSNFITNKGKIPFSEFKIYSKNTFYKKSFLNKLLFPLGDVFTCIYNNDDYLFYTFKPNKYARFFYSLAHIEDLPEDMKSESEIFVDKFESNNFENLESPIQEFRARLTLKFGILYYTSLILLSVLFMYLDFIYNLSDLVVFSFVFIVIFTGIYLRLFLIGKLYALEDFKVKITSEGLTIPKSVGLKDTTYVKYEEISYVKRKFTMMSKPFASFFYRDTIVKNDGSEIKLRSILKPGLMEMLIEKFNLKTKVYPFRYSISFYLLIAWIVFLIFYYYVRM